MRTILVFLLTIGLLAGCASEPGEATSSSADPTLTLSPPPPDPVRPTVDFKGFVNGYTDLKLPQLIDEDRLENYGTEYPERKIAAGDLRAYLEGTPDFPELGETVHFARLGKMKTAAGNWVLLTYQMAAGDHVYATTFTKTGEAIAGKQIVSLPEVPEGINVNAVLDAEGSLILTTRTPKLMSEEGVPIDVEVTQENWQITPEGQIQKVIE